MRHDNDIIRRRLKRQREQTWSLETNVSEESLEIHTSSGATSEALETSEIFREEQPRQSMYTTLPRQPRARDKQSVGTQTHLLNNTETTTPHALRRGSLDTALAMDHHMRQLDRLLAITAVLPQPVIVQLVRWFNSRKRIVAAYGEAMGNSLPTTLTRPASDGISSAGGTLWAASSSTGVEKALHSDRCEKALPQGAHEEPAESSGTVVFRAAS